MKVSVKALQGVVDYDDGAMVVLNAGDTGELTEAKALVLQESGKIKITTKKKKVEAEEPEATGYAALDVPALTALATTREVLPETGTGANSGVVKQDIIDALEADDAKVDYSLKDEAELITLATELGIMPETGTGENGAVTKDDIVAALVQADADSAPA
jgi:hypothetical protein